MKIPPVVGHVVEELLHIRLLAGNPGGFQLGLVSLRRNVALDHLAESFTKMIHNKEDILFVSSVRSSNSHPDLLLTHHQQHPTFSDHTGPQHWTFTF